jgi:RHS repeat-associated protein
MEYQPLTNNSVYTKDSGAVYPYQDVQNPTYVVSRYTVSDGLGGQAGVSYKYAGAKVHLQGGGWLGFREVTITDERTSIKSITDYNQVYNGTQGLPSHTETRLNGTLLSSQDSFWSVLTFPSGAQKYAKLDGALSQSFELDGSVVTCSQVNSSYDTYGNATQIVAKTAATCNSTSAFTKTTTTTYNNDPAAWILGQVLRSQVKSEAPGQIAQTRTAAFTYSPSTGYVATETTEPDQAALSVTTTYSYDSFGNKVQASISGSTFPTRASTSTYDSRGQFPLTTTNALNQSETRVFDPKWGVVTSVTGPNQITTTYSYDGFGRKQIETRADGTSSSMTLAACDASCPPLAIHKVITQSTGLPPATAYVDKLGRTLRTQGVAFDGRLLLQDTKYNNRGQVVRSSLPYYSGDTPRWSISAYDALGRVTSSTAPDGNVTRNAYAGRITRTTNALNQTLTVTKNAAGQVVKSTDNLGNSTIFTYDVFSNVIKTVDAAGNVTTMQYDLRGRKIAMTDLDMGSRSYTYNALSELLSETDAKNQIATVTYDLLGRVQSRTTPEGVSTWIYDTQPKGIGKPANVTGPNGYSETFQYDSFGRPASVQTLIQGTTYTVTNTYDSLGRLDTLTYPTGFKVKNVYNSVGALSEVRDGTSNALYWKANSANEKGQVTSQSYGNGLTTDRVYDTNTGLLQSVRTGSGGAVQSLDYQFDAIGNLTSRRDNNQGYTETFGYDGLNRLIQVAGPQSKAYQYDSIGNITMKSDVGTYLYGAKPHAVTSTAGTVNSTYSYDANGNMLTGADRTLTYTSFNKPAQIVANGITTNFSYDPSNNRIVKSNVNGTTVYLGKLYERLTQGTIVTHKHYVAGAAIVSQTGATTSVRYLHADHLGSTSVITDESGNVVERLSFDAFGKRRAPNGLDATAPITSQTTRGYTGHEQDDESGLVNMNAREYDSLLGRFLTADTIVSSPLSTQSLNRYNYVHNNPLSFTDPSGHKGLSLKQILAYGPAAPIFVNPITMSPGALTAKAIEHYIRVNYHEPWLMEDPDRIPYARAAGVAIINYFGGAEAASLFAGLFDARMTYLMGGDKTDVQQAFVRGSTTTYIMSSMGDWASDAGSAAGSATGSVAADYATQVAVSGVAGGVSAEIQGGDFWQGFVSSAAFAMLDIAAREMRAVMIAQSTGPNSTGDSVGFWGDGFKLGGTRSPGVAGPMGGMQGGQGQFLWMEYARGSWQDYLVEAFAGPHDFVNSFMYESGGNLSITFQNGVMGLLGDVASYANVITATPFVAASVLRPLAPSLSVDLVAPPRY